MLFLMRPRQTYMPYAMPLRPPQASYNLAQQQGYASTRRVAPPAPAAARDPVADLKELAALHTAGMLSEAEFATAKAKVLGTEAGTT